MPYKPYRECSEEEKEKRRANARQYAKKNPEKIKELSRKNRDKNSSNWPSHSPERVKAVHKKFYEKLQADPERKAHYLEVKNAWAKKNREENREVIRAYHNAWNRRNRDKLRAYYEKQTPEQRKRHNFQVRESLNNDPERKERDRQYRIKKRFWIREQVIDRYGGYCVCCGEDNVAFLCIDHVNNDGAAERKSLPSGRVSTQWYKHLMDEPSRRIDLQVLCCNCNIAKHQFGECPHQGGARHIIRTGTQTSST